ncbi:MAG TPA: hypothetical protein VGA98_07550 [Allosphingosinicella sp.]|jgi:hypothetical protein
MTGDDYDYIRERYGLIFISPRRVKHTVTKREGEIEPRRNRAGHYVHVRFDGDSEGLPCHPEELEHVPPNAVIDPVLARQPDVAERLGFIDSTDTRPGQMRRSIHRSHRGEGDNWVD